MKKNSPTNLDYAIMGLLREEALSGYQIRQIFENSEMGNYSSSPGSIYPAIRRLEGLGLLESVTQKEREGKAKKRFRLTGKGRSALLGWLGEKVNPEDISKRMDELLLKFAFMENLIDPPAQVRFLQQIEDLLPKKIEELESFYDQHSQMIPLTGRLAFLHGIEIFRTHFRWVQEAITTILKKITSKS